MKQARFWMTGLSLVALLAAGCGSTTGFGTYGANRAAVTNMRAHSLPANYYDAAQGKQGPALLQTLNSIVYRHTDLGYDRARDAMFSNIDDLDNDDVVECVYIGMELAGVNDRQTAYRNGAGLNAEHTWPQSKGAEGVAKADLHHLFPANCHANSVRSSYPFGVVTSVQWSEDGSKLGTNGQGQTVFEPRDEHKGNVARALLYFYTVYGLNGGLDTSNFRIEEETLKRWNQQDPVDANERQRNDLVFGAQGNRNPYVDHPEYVQAVGVFLNAVRAKVRK